MHTKFIAKFYELCRAFYQIKHNEAKFTCSEVFQLTLDDMKLTITSIHLLAHTMLFILS